MPEEIIGNIETTNEDDIIEPKPSLDQINLWSELENNINQEILEKRSLFLGLPRNIKTIFASEPTSTNLISIGQKYSLTKDQTIALTRYVKELFLDPSEDVEILTLTNSLCRGLNVDTQKGKLIFQDINNVILSPALKNIPNIKNLTESIPNGNRNIVNLKNPSD
ncbi:MAG: hypothetical protein ABIH48_02985 [Candidatus Falkowbacteria bacterium]